MAKDDNSDKHPAVIAKGIVSVSMGLFVMFLIFFRFKSSIVGIQNVPDYLIYLSLLGVLIYIGSIAADKTQNFTYKPGRFLPDFALRFTEAPVFTSVVYLLILQNVPATNNTAALSAIAIYIGLFTRNFEEFFKAIGAALLKPLEDYVQKSTTTVSTKNIDDIVNFYGKGLSEEQIASVTGLTQGTVHDWIEKLKKLGTLK